MLLHRVTHLELMIISLSTIPPAHLESRGTASRDSFFLGQDFTYVHVELYNISFFFQPILGPFRWQPSPQMHQGVLMAWCHLTPNEGALYCLLQIIDKVVNRTSPMRNPCCTPFLTGLQGEQDILITTSWPWSLSYLLNHLFNDLEPNIPPQAQDCWRDCPRSW